MCDLWRVIVIIVLFCASTLPGFVSAKTPKEVASQLFQEGNNLFNQGKFKEALEKFREARTHYPSFKIDLNIASALNELGHFIKAADNYEKFLARGAKLAPPEIVNVARTSLEALRGKLSRVKISCPVADAEIKVDGAPIGQTPLARWIYVNPGSHTFETCKESYTCHEESLALLPGDHKELTMTMELKKAPKAPPKPIANQASPDTKTAALSNRDPAPSSRDDASSESKMSIVTKEAQPANDWKATTGWVTLGVGGASLVTGIIFGAMVSSKVDEYNQAKADGKTYSELQQIKSDGQGYEKGEIAMLVIGGVAVAAGGGLLLWHYLKGRNSEKPSSAFLFPFSTTDTLGIAGRINF